MTTRRAALVLADTMIAHGVDRVFSVPGESFLGLIDVLRTRPSIDFVVARHEGGAGYMAVADAKCTGRPGVCLVSRGPGATNAAIAIHTARQDAAPLVVIVGQVTRRERGRGAFQEVDYERTFADLAKAVWEVRDGAALAGAFARAWVVATTGTPGPVVVAVPEDVFDEETGATPIAPEAPPAREPDDEAIARVADAIALAKRPLVIAGGALGSSEGRRALAAAAERHQVPVALAYKRQDLFRNADPLFAGYLGYKIPDAQVARLGQADLIVAVGTRLTDITTQNDTLPSAPVPAQDLIHVYPDRAQIGRVFATALGIVADPARALAKLADLPARGDLDARAAWARSLHDDARALAAYTPTPRPDGLEFGVVVSAAAGLAARDAVIAVDAGHFSSWVHRLWPWHPDQLLVGAVSGAMGLGVPGAVAASLRFPGRQAIAFVGDGGFMMTGAELATAVRQRVDLTIVVGNNSAYGTIRHHQELMYPGHPYATDLSRVDFAAYAEACGRARLPDSRGGRRRAGAAARRSPSADRRWWTPRSASRRSRPIRRCRRRASAAGARRRTGGRRSVAARPTARRLRGHVRARLPAAARVRAVRAAPLRRRLLVSLVEPAGERLVRARRRQDDELRVRLPGLPRARAHSSAAIISRWSCACRSPARRSGRRCCSCSPTRSARRAGRRRSRRCSSPRIRCSSATR